MILSLWLLPTLQLCHRFIILFFLFHNSGSGTAWDMSNIPIQTNLPGNKSFKIEHFLIFRKLQYTIN